jgi:hypothetical protein
VVNIIEANMLALVAKRLLGENVHELRLIHSPKNELVR